MGAGTRGEATGMWDKYRHTGLKDRDGDGHTGLGCGIRIDTRSWRIGMGMDMRG